MTSARMFPVQSSRLVCHLVEEAQFACPEAAAALYRAAHAVTTDLLARIETAEREANQ